MIKDQASALREMIRLKNEKKKKQKKEKDEEVVVLTENVVETKELNIEKTEGDFMIEEFFSSIENPSFESVDVVANEVVDELVEDIEMETEREIEIIGVCGKSSGIDRSGFLINTAITFKEQGKTPLILSMKTNNPSSLSDWCGVEMTHSLEEVIDGQKNIEDVIISNSVGVYFANLGSEPFGMKEWDETSKESFKSQLSRLREIDVILIDAGLGETKASILHTLFAQQLLVLVDSEQASVTEVYSFLKLLNQYQFKKDIQVVVDKVESEVEAQKIFNLLNVATRKFLSLNLSFAGHIRNDYVVLNSGRLKQPLVLEVNSSLGAQDIRAIATSLIENKTNKCKPQTMKEVAQRFLHVFG